MKVFPLWSVQRLHTIGQSTRSTRQHPCSRYCMLGSEERPGVMRVKSWEHSTHSPAIRLVALTEQKKCRKCHLNMLRKYDKTASLSRQNIFWTLLI